MLQTIDVDGAPAEERCVAVGTADYKIRARYQCSVYMEQLRRELGAEPPGTQFFIREVPHPAGAFVILSFQYDDTSDSALQYVSKIESALPITWDNVARAELTKNE